MSEAENDRFRGNLSELMGHATVATDKDGPEGYPYTICMATVDIKLFSENKKDKGAGFSVPNPDYRPGAEGGPVPSQK